MQEVFNVKDENVFKAASSLSGGIGGMRATCGALLGGSMMLGLMLGSGPNDNFYRDHKPESFELAGKLYQWFEQEFGSSACRSVRARFTREINANNKPLRLSRVNKESRMHEKCDELIGKTCAKTAGIIWDAITNSKQG